MEGKRGTEVKYMAIQEAMEDGARLSLQRACTLMSVSRSGYYGWVKRGATSSSPDPYEIELRDEIQRIAVDYPRYGYRRITKELHRRDHPVNAKRVLRLMREDNLLCVKRRFKPVTTDSEHDLRTDPNLAREIEVTGLNQLWVADITYIRLLTEFIYLAIILDVFSRRCIGWNLDRTLETRLALAALHMALGKRGGEDLSNLVHHSDKGVQYASKEYVEELEANGIEISMSRRGNPYDNAFAESFIKTLKYEEVHLFEYRDYGDAYDNISNFIDEVYNKKRLHSSIGYRPPVEIEEEISLNMHA